MSVTTDTIPSIEALANRKITIESTLTSSNLSKCHLQTQSPIFQLPPELREPIFRYATAQDADPDHPYHDKDPWYRPGYTAKPRYHTSLLSTCRRVWLEANAVPLKHATFTFWMNEDRPRPNWVDPKSDEMERLLSFLSCLTPIARKRLEHLHLFFPQALILDFYDDAMFGLPYVLTHCWGALDKDITRSEEALFSPRVVTATVRRFDWEYWGEGLPVMVFEEGVQNFRSVLWHVARLRVSVLRLELESLVLESPKEMEEIVMRIQSMAREVWVDDEDEFGGCGMVLRDGCDVEDWSGSWDERQLEWKDVPPHEHPYGDMERIEYRVFTLVWDRVSKRSDEVGDQVLPESATEKGDEDAQRRAVVEQYQEKWAREGSLLLFSSERL